MDVERVHLLKSSMLIGGASIYLFKLQMENTLYGFIIGSTVSFAVVQAMQYVLHSRWTAEQE